MEKKRHTLNPNTEEGGYILSSSSVCSGFVHRLHDPERLYLMTSCEQISQVFLLCICLLQMDTQEQYCRTMYDSQLGQYRFNKAAKLYSTDRLLLLKGKNMRQCRMWLTQYVMGL